MSIEHRDSDRQRFYTVEQNGEVLGFIAIDSTICGRARGGLRLVDDVTEGEVRAAARAMTLKYGFLGLPQGGAKAGVRGDGEAEVEQKRQRLGEFARAAAPLLHERVYVPDADLGTGTADIRWMLRSIGLKIGRREWQGSRSGYYTAVSCLAAARAAMTHRRMLLASRRVAIEGFGSVASSLAQLMSKQGATVVALSTSRGAIYNAKGLDVDRLVQLASEVGSRIVELYADGEAIPREELLELPVDLLCPCARYHSIHEGNVQRIAASVVCPGANDPITRNAERVLVERGVICPPDFIANCGGVLGGTLEFAAVRPDRITSLIETHIMQNVSSLLQEAEQREVPPRAVAEPIALARHQRVRLAAETPTFWQRTLARGMDYYRRGWVPKALVEPLAARYIRKLMAS